MHFALQNAHLIRSSNSEKVSLQTFSLDLEHVSYSLMGYSWQSFKKACGWASASVEGIDMFLNILTP